MLLKVFPKLWLAIAEQEGLKVRLNIGVLDFDIAGGRGFHGAGTVPPSGGKKAIKARAKDVKKRLKRKRSAADALGNKGPWKDGLRVAAIWLALEARAQRD